MVDTTIGKGRFLYTPETAWTWKISANSYRQEYNYKLKATKFTTEGGEQKFHILKKIFWQFFLLIIFAFHRKNLKLSLRTTRVQKVSCHAKVMWLSRDWAKWWRSKSTIKPLTFLKLFMAHKLSTFIRRRNRTSSSSGDETWPLHEAKKLRDLAKTTDKGTK